MSVVAPQPLIDRAEYHRRFELGELPDNVYLLDGQLISTMPQNSPHAFAVSLLTEALTLLYQGQRGVRPQCPIVLNDQSEPEPDVAVVMLANSLYRDRHPSPADVLLLIEVADSSAIDDRQYKLPRYFAAEIPEVWLVDLSAKMIRRFTPNPAQLFYREDQFLAGDQIPLPATDTMFSVPVDLFGEVA